MSGTAKMNISPTKNIKLRSLPSESAHNKHGLVDADDVRSNCQTPKKLKCSPTQLISTTYSLRDSSERKLRNEASDDSFENSSSRSPNTVFQAEDDLNKSDLLSSPDTKMMWRLINDNCKAMKQPVLSDVTETLYQCVDTLKGKEDDTKGCLDLDMDVETIKALKPLSKDVQQAPQLVTFSRPWMTEYSTASRSHSQNLQHGQPDVYNPPRDPKCQWTRMSHPQYTVSQSKPRCSTTITQNYRPRATDSKSHASHKKVLLRGDVPLLPSSGSVSANMGCEEYNELCSSRCSSSLSSSSCTDLSPVTGICDDPATNHHLHAPLPPAPTLPPPPRQETQAASEFILDSDNHIGGSDGDSGRYAHNAKERARRARIKSACERLRDLVPGLRSNADKATVLELGVLYIRFLKHVAGPTHDEEFVKKVRGARGSGLFKSMDYS